MAQIALTINGRKRNVNLSKLNWTRAQEINTANSGTTDINDLIYTQTEALIAGTLQNTPTGADTAYYIFKTTHGTPSLLSDTEAPESQGAGRVLYYGARQKTGDKMRDFFKPISTFPDLQPLPANSTIDPEDPEQTVFSQVDDWRYWQSPIYKSGADTSGYLVCYNAIAYIRTEAGGSFGASLCMNNINGVPQNWIGVHSFGAYKDLGALGDGNAHNGNQARGAKPYQPVFDAQNLINYPSNEVSYNASCYSGTNFDGIDPDLTDDITAEMVYTEIGGKPYLGLAACRWHQGQYVEMLEVTLLPAWFWGDYQIPSDPADIPQYHGYDGIPQRQSGSYTYTPNDIELASTPVQPVSGISDTDYGLHVYRISDADYANIQATLWGKGSLADALWNRWNNYKFNPVAGVIGCHVLPKAFMPDVTGMSYSQPRAAGGALETTGQAYHVNGQTTITATAASVSMPEYFSSHLNWDPYTSVQLFLPFCGWISIPADRCIDTTDNGTGSISIQYRCDLITGNVCCYVRCFNADGVNTFSTQVTGNAALSVPITGNDNGTGQILGAITAAAGIAVGALTGGIGTAALVGGAAGAGLAVNTAKHTLQNGSTYSGNVAALGCMQPYLLITMPIEHTSEQWRQLHGLPSGLGLTVGDLTGTGYTELSEFHAEIDCITPEEQQEIENLMNGGVIL